MHSYSNSSIRKVFLNGSSTVSKIRTTTILNDKWNFKPDSLSKYRGGERRGVEEDLERRHFISIVSGTSLCLGQRTVRLGGTMHQANNSPLKRFHRSWPPSPNARNALPPSFSIASHLRPVSFPFLPQPK